MSLISYLLGYFWTFGGMNLQATARLGIVRKRNTCAVVVIIRMT
jgi:hypothetical protein